MADKLGMVWPTGDTSVGDMYSEYVGSFQGRVWFGKWHPTWSGWFFLRKERHCDRPKN